MDREGFHPDYHDERFFESGPGGKDGRRPETARGDPARDRLRRAGTVLARVATSLLAFALVLLVGYALLPGRMSAPPTVPKATQPAAPAAAPAPPLAPAPQAQRPAETVDAARPAAPARPAPPATDAPTLGTTVLKAARSPGGERVIDLVGRALRLPTHDVVATAAAWNGTRTLSPFVYGIDANGHVVEAVPSAWTVLRLGAGVLAAWLLGTLVGRVVRPVPADATPDGGLAWTPGRIASGTVALIGTLAAARHVPDLAQVALALGAVAGLLAPPGTRLRLLVAALGLVSAGMALAVPVVAPYPVLAVEYGPLGVRTWDVVACGTFAACALGWLLAPRRPGLSLQLHLPHAGDPDRRGEGDRPRDG